MERVPDPALRPHGFALRVSEEIDLDETLERLATQGIEPEREPYRVREGGSRLCFVRDPDGYRIELIDRSGR
jgi:catechol 2,3-dioxygenase-like lactoylglutathione lyase family enzyme